MSLMQTRPPADSDSGWDYSEDAYPTEADSVARLDHVLDSIGLFRVYAEVPGHLLHPRPGQERLGVRIDRLLVPNEKMIALGWNAGVVGIEAKRSGAKVGPALAQATDYARSAFTLPFGNMCLVPSWVFVWPGHHRPSGPIASMMVQNHVGLAISNKWSPLVLTGGSHNLLEINHNGEIRVGREAARAGNKVGSR